MKMFENQNYCVYETESSIIVAVKIEFDLSKLRLFLKEDLIKLVISGEVYKNIELPKTVDPSKVKTKRLESDEGYSILRIELTKKQDHLVEIGFSK